MRHNNIPESIEYQDIEFINEYMVQTLLGCPAWTLREIEHFPVGYDFIGFDEENEDTCPVRDDFGYMKSSIMSYYLYNYDDRKQLNSLAYLTATYLKQIDGSVLLEGSITYFCGPYVEDTIDICGVLYPEEFGIAA